MEKTGNMKRQIRVGVFETNSSSTHSITIANKCDYEAWERGELLYCDGDFKTPEEARKKNVKAIHDNFMYNENTEWSRRWSKDRFKEEDIKLYGEGQIDFEELLSRSIEEIHNYELIDYCYISKERYDDYWEDRGLEDFFDSFITKNGDEIVAWGWYGCGG